MDCPPSRSQYSKKKLSVNGHNTVVWQSQYEVYRERIWKGLAGSKSVAIRFVARCLIKLAINLVEFCSHAKDIQTFCDGFRIYVARVARFVTCGFEHVFLYWIHRRTFAITKEIIDHTAGQFSSILARELRPFAVISPTWARCHCRICCRNLALTSTRLTGKQCVVDRASMDTLVSGSILLRSQRIPGIWFEHFATALPRKIAQIFTVDDISSSQLHHHKPLSPWVPVLRSPSHRHTLLLNKSSSSWVPVLRSPSHRHTLLLNKSSSPWVPVLRSPSHRHTPFAHAIDFQHYAYPLVVIPLLRQPPNSSPPNSSPFNTRSLLLSNRHKSPTNPVSS